MLPTGDDDRFLRTTPYITYFLIILNVIFYFVEINSSFEFIVQWAFVPTRFLADPTSDFLTLFTSMFMHAGLMHLGSNMLYLWIFGDNVEDNFGHLKFLIFYLLCGLAATGAQLVFSLDSSIPNLGASGAIAGVLGGYLLLFPRKRVHVMAGLAIIPLPAILVIGFWFVLQLFSGIGTLYYYSDAGGIAYMAHVGGFIAGLVLAFVFKKRREKSNYYDFYHE